MFDLTKRRIADYPLLHSADDMRQICQPLEEHFGVTSYIYFKTMADGTKIHLGTNAQWIAHYYEQKYHVASIFEKHPDKYQSGVVAWSALKTCGTHGTVLDSARDFGIYNGLTLVNPIEGGCEFVFIGVNADNQHLTSFHLNNTDVLQQFHQQFKEQAAGLIKKAEAQPLYFPKAFEPEYVSHEPLPIIQDVTKRDAMVDALRQSANVVLTAREYEVARCLLQGLSMKESARVLAVSARTVESHITRIKEKLGVHFKGDLIAKLRTLVIV